jgi:hypothetical protein
MLAIGISGTAEATSHFRSIGLTHDVYPESVLASSIGARAEKLF